MNNPTDRGPFPVERLRHFSDPQQFGNVVRLRNESGRFTHLYDDGNISSSLQLFPHTLWMLEAMTRELRAVGEWYFDWPTQEGKEQ